ncbi:hypothetical protein ACWEP3_21110 [Streptomyces albidoflavus]
MNGRRPFLVAFLLTAAVWAGVAVPWALADHEPAPAKPGPGASAGPNREDATLPEHVARASPKRT